MGLAALPLHESFKNAAIRRHKAAHVAGADTPQGDISQFVKEAIAIAIGFDFMLSKALNMMQVMDAGYLNGREKISATDVEFRVLRCSGNKWKEYLKGSARAYRTSPDLSILATDAKRRAALNNQFYVQFDENGLIQDWTC